MLLARCPSPPSHHLSRQCTVRRAPTAAAASQFVPYTPVDKRNGYDLRLVSPHPVARTSYDRRDEGFLRLGEYLSGGNAAGARFQVTQPVVMSYPPGGLKTMQVYLVPREGEGEGEAAASQPPQPVDPGVELDAGGGELVAAARFEGNATQQACERARKDLLAALARDGLQLADAEAAGLFRLAQYGPLFSLATRVNEIWVAVTL